MSGVPLMSWPPPEPEPDDWPPRECPPERTRFKSGRAAAETVVQDWLAAVTVTAEDEYGIEVELDEEL